MLTQEFYYTTRKIYLYCFRIIWGILANTQTNKVFLEAIRNGDSAIIRQIYEQNFHVIASMLAKNGGSKEDARDIFQDGLMIIYEKLKSPTFVKLPTTPPSTMKVLRR